MANISTTEIIIYAIVGGFLPALIWLWFWLKEDRQQPEPRRMIFKSVIAGGLSVFLAFILQRYYVNNFVQTDIVDQILNQPIYNLGFFLSALPVLFIWAAIEEGLKFIAVYTTALSSPYNDEPIDPMIYMIAGAVGFVAMENTFFIFDSIFSSGTEDFLITGNLRFLGASLVHIIASAIIGASMSLSYCSKPLIKWRNIFIGLIIGTLLHTLFNFFIITVSETEIFNIFLWWWISAIGLILFFEKVKSIVCSPSFKNK